MSTDLDGVKLGLFSANTGPRGDGPISARIAAHAEQLGLESVWAAEHFVIPLEYESRYPYARSGKLEDGARNQNLPDPLIWLAYAAATTSHINLATGVTVIPLREPIVAAKQIATLDALSDGRVILGVGVGWLEEEFDALRVPFDGRGARHDDYLEAMRALWADDVATVRNKHVSFNAVTTFPKPIERRLPIVIGGSSDRAVRRAARSADGYFPGGNLDLEALSERIKLLHDECAVIGRDPAEVEITVFPDLSDVDSLSSRIEELLAVGVSRILVGEHREDALTALAGALGQRFSLIGPDRANSDPSTPELVAGPASRRVPLPHALGT